MNPKQLVRLSNFIGLTSIILLIYWVTAFVTIEVFGLKVFRENLTESFFLSIFGILALMAGALMINIMFNLTRIANRNSEILDVKPKSSKGLDRKYSLLFILTIPLILALLFGGDYLTSKKKEKLLVNSAKSILTSQRSEMNNLINYQFTEEWIMDTEEALKILSLTDQSLPHVSIIVEDSIKDLSVYLSFRKYYNGNLNDTIQPDKKSFILSTTKDERSYLNNVFNNGKADYRYSSHDGKYELFYPYFEKGNQIVLYFTEYQRYGKIGS